MATTTARPQRTAVPHTSSLAVDRERLQRMWSMRPVDRDAAARRGEFSLGEMLAWARRAPDEIELVNGEFWFIAEQLADTETPLERALAAGRPRSARG
jgi:hypothetical protein